MTSPTDAYTSPSTLSIALATGILAGAAGYMLGTGSWLQRHDASSARRQAKQPPHKSWPNSYDVKLHPDSSDEEVMARLSGAGNTAAGEEESEASEDREDSGEEKLVGDLAAFEGNREECKLVLVVRTDLGMGKGKIAAQTSHATLVCYTHFLANAPDSPILRRWQGGGQAKVAVQCRGEEELLTLQAQAQSLGLCARVIRDAGRTQIAAGSSTVLGVGPGPKSVVDAVTGSLKLL